MLLSNQKSKQNEIGLAKKKKSSVGTGQLFPVNFPRVNKKKKKKKRNEEKTHTHTQRREANSSLLSWLMNHLRPSSFFSHTTQFPHLVVVVVV